MLNTGAEGWVKTVGEKLNQYGRLEVSWTHFCSPCGGRKMIHTRYIKPDKVEQIACPDVCRFCAQWAIARLFDLLTRMTDVNKHVLVMDPEIRTLCGVPTSNIPPQGALLTEQAKRRKKGKGVCPECWDVLTTMAAEEAV